MAQFFKKFTQIGKEQAYFSKVNDSETDVYYAANNKITKYIKALFKI